MLEHAHILPNEQELFARMAKGDEAAFADIFFYYIPILQPHLQKMTQQEETTRDIIHDVFMKLWMNREKLGEIDNYRAYIFTISTNRTYDWLRKVGHERKAMARLAQEATELTGNTTEEMIDLHASTDLINEAIAQMPPQRKLIFTLSREEGLSHDEIAERLNISKNTVSNHLTEALRNIKEYLKQQPGMNGSSMLALVLAAKLWG